MAERTRRNYSAEENMELWQRWVAGDSISSIAQCLNRKPGTIHTMLSKFGGIPPGSRRRPPNALSRKEREEISRGISSGESLRHIANRLGRSASTITREVKRNGGSSSYRASAAEDTAKMNRLRPKQCVLAQTPKLCRIVAGKLKKKWSPEQIAGWLKLEYPEDKSMQVSHETIYKTLYIQARGALKKELKKHLRTRRGMRRSKHSTTKGQTRGQIIDAVSISERPAEVEDRAVPGHWEGDMISGSKNSHIATLVERKTRFTMLVRLTGKDSKTVASALKRKIKRLPAELKQSLTWDRGPELAKHKEITISADVKIYFCDPQSPWQRGTNENTNGLLRQYFPKGTDLSKFSQGELNKVARSLNTRPRKTLGFRTPAAVLSESVASTG